MTNSKSEVVHKYVSLSEIDPLRDACHDRDLRYDSLGRRLRDESIIVLLMDLGLRCNELRNLKRENFRLSEGEVVLPASIQKDYPVEGVSPSSATLELDPYGHFSTVRLLKGYFGSDWYQSRESEYVLPSRQSSQMSNQSIRNTVRDLAEEADTTIYTSDGGRADAEDAHPHMFRHSLANYMLQDKETRLVDVRNRLRHRSIQTTESVYEHFQRR